MSLVARAVLYTLCLALVMIVYTGQKETNARDTLRAASRMTGKWLAWSAVGAASMLVLQMLFVD